MAIINHKIGGYTTKEAADMVGVSESRIRQLAVDHLIESEKVLGRIIVSDKGIKQAKARNKQSGRPALVKNGSKV